MVYFASVRWSARARVICPSLGGGAGVDDDGRPTEGTPQKLTEAKDGGVDGELHLVLVQVRAVGRRVEQPPHARRLHFGALPRGRALRPRHGVAQHPLVAATAPRVW